MLYASSVADLYALNASTGALLWQYTTACMVDSAPAVANGVVYTDCKPIWTDDGWTYALDAGTGVLLWKYAMAVQDLSSPAVVNGMVYVGEISHYSLYAFGLPSQQMSEKFSPPQRPDPARLTPDWSLQPSSQVTLPLKK